MDNLDNLIKGAPSKKKFPELVSIMSRLNIMNSINVLEYSIISELYTYFVNNQFSDKPKKHLQVFSAAICEQFFILIKKFEENTSNYENYHKIVNLSLYLLIIIYNLRKCNGFLEFIFDKESNIILIIKKLLTICSGLKDQMEITMIYSTIFCDEEFLLSIKSVGNLVNEHKLSLSKFGLFPVEIYPTQVYYCILEYLVKVEYSFEELFEQKICEDSDKPTVKALFIQSVVRIIFSFHKILYETEEKNIEINFLNAAIKKCVTYYYNLFEGKVTSLFRREEVTDLIMNT